MNKTVKIDGMMCEHCVKHVSDALKALGADPVVSLEEGTALLHETALSDEQIMEAIENAGYTVIGIENGD